MSHLQNPIPNAGLEFVFRATEAPQYLHLQHHVELVQPAHTGQSQLGSSKRCQAELYGQMSGWLNSSHFFDKKTKTKKKKHPHNYLEDAGLSEHGGWVELFAQCDQNNRLIFTHPLPKTGR